MELLVTSKSANLLADLESRFQDLQSKYTEEVEVSSKRILRA